MKSKSKETVVRTLCLIVSFSSLGVLAGIVMILFLEGLPIFRVASIGEFLLGSEWYPSYHPPDYGALPLILASLFVTAIAMGIAIPVGIGSAIFMACVMPRRARTVVKPTIELLAGVPSVIYGLFGMRIMGPWIQELFGLPTGLTALTAGVMLGIMALPTIVSMSDDAISAISNEYRDASLALGSTHLEAIVRAVLPISLSGIITSVILGMSRAIGETMTVLMVAGGAAVIPTTIFGPVRPMTATIAGEMGQTAVGSNHYHALFAIAIILFFITLIFNVIADQTTERFKGRVGSQ